MWCITGGQPFGRYAKGGRGGKVCEVTTLADGGAGNLRDALGKSGAKTIVFRVSGTIDLKSALSVKFQHDLVAL